MNAMKVILRATHTRGAEICVIDNSSHRLNKVSKEVNARYIDTDQDLFNYFSELMGIFVERNNKKYSYVEDGFDDQEIYEKMKEFPPIFIFISDLMTFLDMVYNPDKSVGNMSGFFENICEKGSLHNIYLISCYNIDDYSKLTDYKAFYQLTSYKKGLHCGGNLANQRMYNFSNISYQEQGKTLKPGIAYTPSSEDDSIGLKVVLPLVRG